MTDADDDGTPTTQSKVEEKKDENDVDQILLKSEFAKASFDHEKWTSDRFVNTTHQLMKEKQRELQRLVAKHRCFYSPSSYSSFHSASSWIVYSISFVSKNKNKTEIVGCTRTEIRSIRQLCDIY